MTKKPSPSGLHKGDAVVTDWPTIRGWILKRDEYLCQTCKVNTANEVDHIWPRRLGGPDHIDNLRAICGPCNKLKGARVDLAAASESQLSMARSALRSRIVALESEYNDVINEHLRRRGGEPGAKALLYLIRADLRKQTGIVEQWEALFDAASPPRDLRARLSSLEIAVLRATDRDASAEAGESTEADLRRIARVYGLFRRLVDAVLPGLAYEFSRPLPDAATRAEVLRWLQASEADSRHASETYHTTRERAAHLLAYMPDESTTVEAAVEARKKAQP